MRCVLVPEHDFRSFEVQLIRGRERLDVQTVTSVDAAYPIARRWQLENRAPRQSTSTAA
jgi:hypothetical protein